VGFVIIQRDFKPRTLHVVEQVFDRRSTVELYLNMVVRYGLVNLDASVHQTSCDEPLVETPCYTTLGLDAMPQLSPLRPNLSPMPSATPQPTQRGEPRFLYQVADACRVKHLAYRSEQSYVSWVKRFILFHQKRHPRDKGPIKVCAFLTHLAVNYRVAAFTQKQALNAFVFMYREVVRRDQSEFDGFDRAMRPKRLPTVLTRDEVKLVLSMYRGIGTVSIHSDAPSGYAMESGSE